MSHRIKNFTRLAGRGVHAYSMIGDGDRILVGLSGGKDSLALLWYLQERKARTPIDYHLEAAHLDMGFDDPEQVDALRQTVEGLGVDFIFEKTDYAHVAHSQINRENPCFLCSRLRRKRLFEMARDRGCAKVALGHHRDDLNETLLMNIFYSGEISTMMPVQPFFEGLLTIIRPLCMVPKSLIERLIRSLGWPLVENRCPSSGRTRRQEVREIIRRLETENKKTPGNIFHSMSNYKPEYLLKVRQDRYALDIESLADPAKDNKMDAEQRKRTRVKFRAMVDLIAPQRRLSNLSSHNISLKGLYVESVEKLDMDTTVDIRLILSGFSSEVALNLKGRVARLDEDGMGIDFTEVEIDSFYHLRNIVLYNTENPSDVDEELVAKPAF